MPEPTVRTVEEVVRRAKSQVGRPVRYRLGAGGMSPLASGPEDARGECDCSGFVAWCLGVSRYIVHYVPDWPYGEWFNTETMTKCVVSPDCWILDRLEGPTVGALAVYPWRGRRPGHVGIVTSVADDGSWRVVHCSAGNFRKYGFAIAETDASIFLMRPDLVYAWPSWIERDV